MDTERLSRWLTLGANLAVLASIVFLAIEIQQNTEMTRAQITQSRAETAISLAEMLFMLLVDVELFHSRSHRLFAGHALELIHLRKHHQGG